MGLFDQSTKMCAIHYPKIRQSTLINIWIPSVNCLDPDNSNRVVNIQKTLGNRLGPVNSNQVVNIQMTSTNSPGPVNNNRVFPNLVDGKSLNLEEHFQIWKNTISCRSIKNISSRRHRIPLVFVGTLAQIIASSLVLISQNF